MSAVANEVGTQVTLYSCPTGGWVMGNRTTMEACIKEQIPDAQVTHKVGIPFTAVVEINGTKGKRECGPFVYCLPAALHCQAFATCCGAEQTGKNAKELYDGLNSQEMVR